MPDQQLEAGSSAFWVDRLARRLLARRDRLLLFDRYYDGEHRLAFAGTKYREAFGNLFRAFADNFCLLVVDAELERLNVEGFRIGADQVADAEAWDIWQENDLDARSAIAHTEALVKEQSYAIVWRGSTGRPLITIEDPLEVIVDQDFGGRGPRRAALKLWLDEDSQKLMLTLYLPDRIEKYIGREKLRRGAININRWTNLAEYEPRAVEGEPWPLPNALGVVPVVPLVNNPRLSGEGRSEIKAVIPVQDAINKTIADMLIASEFSAFRQRWVTGIDIPTDENGRPVEPFKAAVDRIFVANPPDGGEMPRFGEFSQTDLSGYVSTVEMLVQHIATITKTPAHYMLGQSGAFPSGEALKATETGLVAKARRQMRYFGEAWEEVVRLALRVAGSAKADATAMETVWRDPESKVQSELTDAVMKEATLGVPQEALWEKLGYSPQQIARFRRMAARTALLAVTPAPTPEPSARNATVARAQA